ncbi:MAG: diaminopimelate decarboxylase [Anaerovoracaceae bacterium]|jgi:diaminopimelate decarboxylase
MKTLQIAGIPAAELAAQYGTPLIVYDAEQIRRQFAAYTENFVSDRFATEIVYASKAFTCPAMIDEVKAAGASLEVVSGGEMMIAHAAGMPMERVYFHGNNKTAAELRACMETGCGCIVLDNREELDAVIAAAEAAGRTIDALLRINPLVEAHTHEFIVTAAADSKFGISIEESDDIAALVERAQSSGCVRLRGFHSHIGSQIFGSEAFTRAAEKIFAFLRALRDQCGFEAHWLSLGGGFGIRYTGEDRPLATPELCRRLIRCCEDADWPLEKLMIEPGRSIVGEAGTTLYTVGYQKMAGGRRYLFVDGGMGDNIRPALYDARYDADIAGRLDAPRDTVCTVAGKYCESGDVLIRDIALQRAQSGDLLAMYSTGAYGYSMASCYNGIGRPAVVFAADGTSRLVLRRETWRDLLALSVVDGAPDAGGRGQSAGKEGQR